MAETALQLIQNVADRIGVKRPDSLTGSNQTTRRFLSVAQSVGRDLMGWHFESLRFEHTFTTADGVTEYALPTNPPYHHMSVGTYDQTNAQEVEGPLSSLNYRRTKGLNMGVNQLNQEFAIRMTTSTPRELKFVLLGDPGGAYTIAYDYYTTQWVYDGSSTYRTKIQSDSDLVLFDDYLFELGIEWKVLKQLGRAYFEEQDAYEARRDSCLAKGANMRPIKLGVSRKVRRLPNIPITGYGGV